MNKILKYYFLFSISILFTQEINNIKSVIIAENLNRPVFAVFEPGTNKMYAVEQTGKIYLINNLQNKSLFLDLSKKISVSITPDERGLLGMVFDPNFQSNGFFYVSYIDTENYSVVSRFRLSENKDEVKYIDCSNVKLPYFNNLINDVKNRSETATSQDLTFLSMELALKAQEMAEKK